MLQKMIMGSSGSGGSSLNITAPDVVKTNDSVGQESTITANVTQKPKWIFVTTNLIAYGRISFYAYDVDNNKLFYGGRISSGWTYGDISSTISTNFPTVSSSQVTFFNNNGAQAVGMYIYY